MVLMALDHAATILGPPRFIVASVGRASPAEFLTYWMPHLCGPAFLFLAGIAACLHGRKLASRNRLAAFLASRGCLLLLLELLVVSPSWGLYRSYWSIGLQILWVIGWSMLALAAVLWLPRWLLLLGAILIITGHNGFDAWQFGTDNRLRELWMILHQQGWLYVSKTMVVSVLWPIIPWPAIMVLGYLAGDLYSGLASRRRRFLLTAGVGAAAAFLLLRLTRAYGDPSSWSDPDRGIVYTVLAVLDTTKHPASLHFVLMTLSPVLIALPLLERPLPSWTRPVELIGRVPLFFYLLHVPLLQLLALVWFQATYRGHAAGWWLRSPASWPSEYEPSLLSVYLATVVVLLMLYLPCRWFAELKADRRYVWTSYL